MIQQHETNSNNSSQVLSERKSQSKKPEKIEKSPNENRVIGIKAHNVEIIVEIARLELNEQSLKHELKAVVQAAAAAVEFNLRWEKKNEKTRNLLKNQLTSAEQRFYAPLTRQKIFDRTKKSF